MKEILLVFIGGGMGSIVRYGISKFMMVFIEHPKFPMATLISNFLSCLILGLLVLYVGGKEYSPAIRFFLVIGFCGGFSTFSSFSLETVELFRTGHIQYAILNIAISMIICIGTIFIFTRNLSTPP